MVGFPLPAPTLNSSFDDKHLEAQLEGKCLARALQQQTISIRGARTHNLKNIMKILKQFHAKKITVMLLVGSTLLVGCAVAPPSGPSVMALPGSGKNFDQFRYDDADQ